jgi:C4-dicarboxylate-specific signal transduction histidine kinase
MLGNVGLSLTGLLLWVPGMVWFHILSDSLIALAYFVVPIVLVRSVRGRAEIPVNGAVFCIGAFIVACGVTDHVIEAVALLHPAYWIGGALKTATVVLAATIFVVLLRWMPAILAIPSHADLKEILNRRTASVLENTTVCVIAADSKWKVHYINSNAAKLLKVEGDIQGMTLWDVFPGQQASERDVLMKVMETRQPASFEGYYMPLDLSSTAQVHPWDGGGIAVFFSDVSEQKRLQRELERERATRNQRIEVLAQFSAGLAHEIKNPLAIIHARASDLAELAADGNAPPVDAVAKACGSIVKTSDRALRILRGLEALARDGTHDPKRKADVGGMMHLAAELVQRRYETHGIALNITVPSGLPGVECREVQVGQVLLNLLNNAFDAIDISLASERWVRIEASVEQSAGDDGERVLIDVVDSGPALTEETKEHLMEAFYTTKPRGEGIGIGLSVSRAIAEEHGGNLDLRDCDGHTCFRLSLPVHAAEAEKVAA